MGVRHKAAGLHSLDCELFALLLQHVPSRRDRRHLFCTCTAVRDTMLRAVGLPQGPQLTYDLHATAAPLQIKYYGQLCMKLWLKEGPRLQRACNTAVKAAGCVLLRIGSFKDRCHTRHPATSAQLTQLMAVGTWRGLTVIHLKDVLLDQLVPDVLARHCPHLHTLHLVPYCHLLGLGVPTDVWERAQHINEQRGVRRANHDFNLQQHVLNCPSRTILHLLRPTSCPQLRHLTLDVRSVWPEVQRLFACEHGTRSDLAERMGKIWQGMDAAPRIITQLEVAQLAAVNEQEQQQVADRIESVRAEWEEAHEAETRHLEKAIADVEDAKMKSVGRCLDKQPGGQVDWSQVSEVAKAVCSTPMPVLNANGHSTAVALVETLKQAELLHVGLMVGQLRAFDEQLYKLERLLESVRKKFEVQQEQMVAWWDVHSKLVRCNDNAQYAQQRHQALQPQVQQQLAALPNLSSLHITEGTDTPPGLTEGVLQLGSHITALELETEWGLDYHQVTTQGGDRCSNRLVMAQQLDSVCSQLTNLQQLQWGPVVHDEGMHHLLKLPHLQHVTLVVKLTQSFSDVQCSWHSLTTMHSEPFESNSTCKQLAYLPLASLQQRVRVVRYSDVDVASSDTHPQLFAFTSDPDADLAIVQQACSNVARCGGVSWVFKPSVYEQDTPCIVCEPQGPSIFFDVEDLEYLEGAECQASLQQLQVLEASLPLLQKVSMHMVVVKCVPLDAGVMAVLAPYLIAWGVRMLDLRHSIVSKNYLPLFLGLLPPGITHLVVNFKLQRGEYDYSPCWTASSLMQLCAGASRPITITLKWVDDCAYNKSQYQAEMATAHPLVTLIIVNK